MATGPSKIAEAIVALFVPPACREEVLGDLYERFRSPRQYFLDALRAVPLVILSRIRRSTDPQIFVLQALFLYLAFLGAAWFRGRELLLEQRLLGQLAIPAAAILVGLLLEDAYAKPGRRSAWKLARGPAVGLGFALLSQVMLWAGRLPLWIMLYGCAMSFVMSSMLRLFFPPATGQTLGANGPAHLLKETDEAVDGAHAFAKAARIAAIVIVGVGILSLIPPWPSFPVLVVVVIVYQVWKRE